MTRFRLDRFLTLRFFYPLVRGTKSVSEPRVPVLMYHSISDDEEHDLHPYYRINTTPAIFAEHMGFLKENGYTVIDLTDLGHCLATGPTIKKFVAITFDDGYDDFHANAFPILQEHHFTPTVFLPTAFIGNNKERFPGRKHLTWDQVSWLSDRGINFGSHTATHPSLTALKTEEVEHEIRTSKEIIEEKLGQAIHTFSYPFKFPDANTQFKAMLRELLKRNGYACGVTTRIGLTSRQDDRFFMKRIPVNSCDDIPLFQAKLEGGYDWLYPLQRFRKLMASKLRW